MSHDVARAGLLDFSPTFNPPSRRSGDKTNKENEASVPVLSLVQFSRSPFVAFGTIKLGSSRSLPLRIENPCEDAFTTVTVDKISSSKGFSVDPTSFTIQPEDSVIITVTWTPVEEGGVRELLSFVANGVVKHQAILLGKAEATKKKKKSLWDSIKSKRDISTVSKGVKEATMPIKSANKTFHVSRQPQYRRNRGSNPLSPLNQERSSRRSSGSKDRNGLSACPLIPQDLPKSIQANLENLPLHKNSPVVLLVPADKILDASDKTNSSCLPLPKEVRVLNKTLSPIRTPETFSNPLTSCFQSPLPVIGKIVNDGSQEPRTPTLSVKDALAVIESDLTHAVSPPNACSSFNFSDSLESEHLNADCEPEAATRAVENVPPQVDVAQPRLTFFVKSNKVLNDKSGHDGFMHSTAVCSSTVIKSYNRLDDEQDQKGTKSKKILFSSATVTKAKAEATVEHSPGTRKIRTSRRRLLEKTSSLSDPSNAESNTVLSQGVSALPVINCDTDVEFKFIVTSPQVSPQRLMTQQPALKDQSTSTFSVPLQPASVTDANLNPTVPVDRPTSEMLPSCVSLDSFPVHSQVSKQNKKRKSEEFSRDCSDVAKSIQVQKGCSVAQESKKPCPEKRLSARTGCKPTAPPASRKSTKVPPKKSCPKSTQQGGQSLKSFSTSSVKTSKVIAVAQARLNFIKPTQTAIPRHPLPFAAKNMFYDERWLEKQERGFTWWMNYVLTPDDFKVTTEVAKVNALSLTMGEEKFNIPKAPTKEEMSFRTYTARRRLNRLRRAACQLFTSDSMVKAIQRLELEVEAKRLLVRKDRHLWKDIGERQKVLNWLLSYNPLWLRIGLETIFGELIPLESNSDVMGLAMFILGRLLWNPDIAAEFRHPKVPHLYRDGHEETLSRFTLKKLLLLVCFLDKAKESRLIEHDPCLFCMDAEFKSTKDLLLAFARDFLSGEGILSRHLNLLGLPVSHVQTPLAEFSFAVQNLAVDLRCGIRLVRVMELFTQDWSLSSKLRMPAISRLQKVHNVDIALQALKEKGVDLKDERGTVIDSRDIVDGHREKTLNLLWKIIFTFQVEVLLDEEQLKDEISFLKKTWRTKQKLAWLKADKCAVKISKGSPRFEQPSEKLTLLMDWVNAVCDFYNLKAENFTVSFSDGRVLCYLIHHYHPNCLLAESIQQKTTQTIECDLRGKVELNNSSSDSDCSFDSLEQKGPGSPPVDFRELLENEKGNFQLVNTAVSYLGGVPAMISPEDMSNTIPNEKVVTCYLSFLCARLLDLRNETRAARVIQSAWRRYKLQKDIQLNQQRNLAACKIQALVRSFLQKRRLKRHNRAATTIQAFWRGYSAQRELRRMKEAKHFAIQNRAAVLIQKTYRGWSTRTFLKKNHACVIIQTAFRNWLARKMMQRNAAALRIQTWYRMHRCQRQYLAIKSTAIYIQAWLRGNCQRRKFQTLKKQHQSAIVIQSAFRGSLVRKQIRQMRQSAVIIQRWYQACLQRNAEQRRYLEIKSATVTLQAAFRGWKARAEMAQRHQAALVIQTAYRRFVAQRFFFSLKRSVVIVQQRYRAKVVGDKLRKEYQALKHAAVKTQALWRGRAERKRINQLHQCATVIQSHYRRYVMQRQFVALKHAALVIQRRYRAFRVGRKIQAEFLAMKKAVTVLQSAYRGMKARRELVKKHEAATLIQTYVRVFMCRKKFLAQKSAAIIIQQHYRAHILRCSERDYYVQLRQATISLQAVYRGSRVRRELNKKQQAATVIQAFFKMYKARVSYLAAKCAAIIIQQRYRAHICGKRTRASYLRVKTAIVTIQSGFRGMKVRRDLQKMHLAATTIQACFRGHSQLVKYRRQKWAAYVIQRRFRANEMKNAVEKQYMAMKKAALCIQSAYRGMRTRRELVKKHKSATLIQTFVRAFMCRKKFLAQKSAAIIIQQHYRAHILRCSERDYYVQLRQATISLQAVYRGSRVRRELKKKQQAATVIQACFRMYKARVSYLAAKCATIIIQQRYRAHICGKRTRASYQRMKTAIVTIQSGFRGMKVRRDLQKMRLAATIIQACFRGHSQLVKYRRQKWAAYVIQRQFRANKMKNAVEKQYTAMKKAALCIQSAYRGMRTRKQIAEMQMAARVIQRRYKAYKQYNDYQTLKQATIIIQRRYRAKLLAKQQRERYCAMQKAAISLQAAYRGMSVRKELQKRHEAATVIQAWYRMYRVRMAFRAMRLAAVLVQRQYRCHLKRKEARKSFLKLHHSAIVIQAVFRGNRTRREITKLHSAATVIQRRYVAYKERKSFLSIKTTVELCQRKWRAVLAARRERKAYLAKRNAAIAIQAACRGMKVRRQMRMEREAAITIQSHVRKLIIKRYYQKLLWATRTVQQRFQAHRMMKQDVESFKEKKRAAAVLQAAFRGMKARQALKQKHQAAIVLQSAYRAHCAQTRYLCMKYAAIAIQQRYRSMLAARKQRRDFLKLRHAAISLQALFRGQKVRREIIQQHQAATLIQASFRKHREVMKYQAMRLSAMIIQRHYRSYVEVKVEREKYLMVRKSVILIQAAFRGYSVRRTVAEMNKAATIIQAVFRMHKQRSVFKRQYWAASALQKRFRAWKLGRQQRQRYQRLKDAAICLQKSFRGKQARDLVKRIKAARTVQSYLRMSIQRRRYLKTRAAIVLIQSAYRRHYCRLQYARTRNSAVLIQQWYRSCKLVQKQRNDFKAVQKATLTLQCALRGLFSRRLAKRRRAAVKIQSVLRMHVHRSRYTKLRSCTMKLQAHYRMQTARRTYLRHQTAAVAVQTFYRAYRAKLEQRQRYLRTLESVRTLQAHVRGFIEYRRFQKMKESAVTIQAFYRGMIERRKFQHLKTAVHVIQSRYRAYQLCQRERTQFLKLRRSAILIQAGFRAYQTRKFEAQTRAALTIQAWFRGCQARHDYISKQTAIAFIHRCLQTRLQRARFRAIQHSVRVIQQRWRETLIARKQQADFLRIRKSAVDVQALWRGSRVRKSVQKERNAAVVIQSAFRGYRQRQTFNQKKAVVLKLQRHFRALQLAKAEKENQRRRNAAAVTIQAFGRGWLARQRAKEAASAVRRHRFIAAAYHNLCAVRIQRALRAHWALKAAKRQISSVIYIQRWFKAKIQRKRYLEQRQKIITMQRAVKAWLGHRNQAATVIQRAAKGFLLRRRKERQQQGVTKLQALWRGHCSRKVHDTKKVISIRHRLRKVNREAKEEDKLCNKTATALSYLLGYQNYAYILAALRHLETATRLSPECCERLVKSGATHTIFTLIRSCNRSVPSMEIITLATQVLLNLSKYNKTIEAVYEVPDSVDTLLDLLQIYREKAGDKVADKGGSIFTKACFLLVILVQDQERAVGVKKLPKASERICSIYRLTLRKYKMDAQRTQVKQRMNVSLNGSFLPPPTPQKSKPVARFAPDWVLHRGKMKDIVDPLGAIQMLVKALALMP
ncbi:abnormal spindle-like microcephaly-associated protein [Colossoma macropomum]|uniref:abnormal spindle-like microcephaly-associated protein n=1 Tax=Colossoma macropomum TaxID=42526 RepID=UPI001864E14C|nr:abnormal spindle-like microcephaly-associated protein [Colossoma macropomum]